LTSPNDRRVDGFTLVEVLLLIVILGSLAAIAIFAVGPAVGAGKSKARVGDERVLSRAEEAFFANRNTGRYATQTELVSAGFLRRASTINSLCVDLAPTNGDFFVVAGVPATQAEGDSACAAAAAAFSPPKSGSYVASAGTLSIP
jgi:type II secretory pathway pseudopilin PulG